ncbi:hypothetical protein AAU01_09940 [Paenarthrobacter aurescens]|uniref:Uncharacterized protein n=1 Tax=Paenarthrobacter aurescens TaxID=43663 RepID=A0A4Y3NHP6_PAEAU|nr:hypothetical protein AAU01_09940 [Paenarthrobacter aurescens]
MKQADCGAHDDGARRSAGYRRSSGDCGQRYSGQHSVAYGFAKKGHAPNDNPGSYNTADDRDESSPNEGPEDEVCGKRFS